jgi:hypothetical protein
LLVVASMKTSAAIAVIVLSLCAPALADPAPAAPSYKLRFTLHDASAARTFLVVVGPRLPCATATEKQSDRESDLRACVVDDTHLEVSWSTRSATHEYRSSSSLPLAAGMTADLGSGDGPRLTIAVQ